MNTCLVELMIQGMTMTPLLRGLNVLSSIPTQPDPHLEELKKET
ncbi:MAG TPA: hypothetical protein VFQ23_23620 [Anaerolineales bacterium]|nr:hypothetical protein [Anaerolineales bacterium]